MLEPQPTLTEQDVHRYVEQRCFSPVSEGLVGVESEWLVVPLDNPATPPALGVLEDAVAAAGLLSGRVTFEPGGQLELSTPPLPLSRACDTVAADLRSLRWALRGHGLGLVGLGLDPLRPPRRIVRSGRYDAMEAYFDAGGRAGRVMMCSTASVQVNLDLGSGPDMHRRWDLAHRLGPAIAAAFSNSSIGREGPTNLCSARLATWQALDVGRTGAAAAAGLSPAAAWTRYALEACVMMVRHPTGTCRPVRPRLSFRRWIEQGHDGVRPRVDDLEYHLTTLFPPVRPRGWLELRMIDALPDPWWRAAVAVSAALLYDEEAGRRALVEGGPAGGLWTDAARHGLAHPALARAARACFSAALDALPGLRCDPATHAVVGGYFDRFVARGRSPADDSFDEWTSPGRQRRPAQRKEATWT